MTRNLIIFSFALMVVMIFDVIPCSLAEENVSVSTQVRVVAKAQVTLTIINQPPSVGGISMPAVAHLRDTLFCTPRVIDEHPETVRVRTKWFINERPVAETANLDLTAYSVRIGDNIRCVVTPIDQEGLIGTAVDSSSVVTNRPGIGWLTDIF